MRRAVLVIIFALILASFAVAPAMADRTMGFSRDYPYRGYSHYHYYRRDFHRPHHFHHRGHYPYNYFLWYFGTPYYPYRFYPYYPPTYPYPPVYYYYKPYGTLSFGFGFTFR